MDIVSMLPESTYQDLLRAMDAKSTRDMYNFLLHSKIFIQQEPHPLLNNTYSLRIRVKEQVANKYKSKIKKIKHAVRCALLQSSKRTIIGIYIDLEEESPAE